MPWLLILLAGGLVGTAVTVVLVRLRSLSAKPRKLEEERQRATDETFARNQRSLLQRKLAETQRPPPMPADPAAAKPASSASEPTPRPQPTSPPPPVEE